MQATETTTWFVSKGSGGQGLIADEVTGRTVAVFYDEADKDLLAAAPELLQACKDLLEIFEGYDEDWDSDSVGVYLIAEAKRIINKAEGRAMQEATPRPKYRKSNCGSVIMDEHGHIQIDLRYCKDGTGDILIDALNEHDARVRVCEAAESLVKLYNAPDRLGSIDSAVFELRAALAALGKVGA